MNASSNITLRIDKAYRQAIKAGPLRAAARYTLQHQQTGGALTIVITGDEQLQALNRQYRRVDAPTDVLAFPTGETTGVPPPAGPPWAGLGEPAYLGDVIISYPRAQAQAQAAGHPVRVELQLLVIHGVLHLLGHDHATPAQKRTMWAAQTQILSRVASQGA